MNQTKVANKLINEKSPYLLQHAYNPINWYPWNDEAFLKAKNENKPIFLSIGYSTCHWCHVMERESFEDDEVANILNEYFIAIKVDREERPDIDNVYMEVCHALNGSGGWPLTIVMTPNKLPFFATTYLPKHNYGNRIGLTQLLITIAYEWQNNKDKLIESANHISSILKESIETNQSDVLDSHIVEKAYNALEMSFDKKYGGFNSKPKFPSPHNLMFLLRYSLAKNDAKALQMVEKTLKQMYKGGIFDHIGYGFSRYSVDEYWLVPHFEKMLYDNALLTITYIETYLTTKNELYKEIAEKTLEYISRDMTDITSGFYTAEDADSSGVEGKFYLWDKEEIYQLLNKSDADYFCEYYNITSKGNFENQNILNLIHFDDTLPIDNERIKSLRNILFNYREKRVHPHKDEKILTANNALMIVAFTKAYKAFNNEKYLETAKNTCDFIIKNLIDKNERLLARYKDKEAKYNAYLDDYAFFIWSLIELYLATSEQTYINYAIKLNNQMIELFYDKQNGGFFYVGNDSEQLFMNNKVLYDGAIPSGNSVATNNLLMLAEITDDIKLEEMARSQFLCFASKINEAPVAYTYMLLTYLYYKSIKRKIVIVLSKENKELNLIRKIINSKFNIFTTIIILYKEDIANDETFSYYYDNKHDISMFVCENYSCDEPLYNVNEIIETLMKL